jgi:hypothetical protein
VSRLAVRVHRLEASARTRRQRTIIVTATTQADADRQLAALRVAGAYRDGDEVLSIIGVRQPGLPSVVPDLDAFIASIDGQSRGLPSEYCRSRSPSREACTS